MSQLIVVSLLLLLIGFIGSGRSSSATVSAIKDDVERLNEIWNRAWLEKDAALIEKLMADDYVYIAPNGKVIDRRTILNVIKSTSYHLEYSTRTPVLVKPAGGDAAVMVFRSQAAGSLAGKSFKDDHKCTMLCVRQGSGWRVLLEQCTPNSE